MAERLRTVPRGFAKACGCRQESRYQHHPRCWPGGRLPLTWATSPAEGRTGPRSPAPASLPSARLQRSSLRAAYPDCGRRKHSAPLRACGKRRPGANQVPPANFRDQLRPDGESRTPAATAQPSGRDTPPRLGAVVRSPPALECSIGRESFPRCLATEGPHASRHHLSESPLVGLDGPVSPAQPCCRINGDRSVHQGR